MDNWFPLWRRDRRGRSSYSTYTFDREAPGLAIRSQQPYAWIDSLVHENELRMEREDSDLVYRGDVKPSESCAPTALNVALLPDTPDDEDNQAEPQTPPATPARRSSAPIERASSPITPLPQAPPASPDSAPTERASSPITPLPPRMRTYSQRDRKRFAAEREAAHVIAEQRRDALRAAREAHLLARAQAPTRRSRRLRCGRVGDSTDHGVFEAEQLLRAGHQLHRYINEFPRPLLDRKSFVIGAVAGAPKGQATWWMDDVLAAAQKLMARLYRNADFSHLGESESVVRFGVGFGEDYAAPHQIGNSGETFKDVVDIMCSPAFEALSAYHNHLYQQFAPKSYAKVSTQVTELVSRRIAYPAFEHSVFTTSEISFGDAPALSQKNGMADIQTMEALTVVGSWDYRERGHLIWWQDEGMIELRPGSTIIFPSGTKRFSLGAVAVHETRYVFRQYCHAAVLRWMQKGGRSDSEFENLASAEEVRAWQATRERRGIEAAKLYTKIGDVFVF